MKTWGSDQFMLWLLYTPLSQTTEKDAGWTLQPVCAL
jgi:hypothetical protein